MSGGGDAEVVVIGSGPAGVSAAWPLVRAGVRVLMLDASDGAVAPSSPTGSIGAFRRAPGRWRSQFGATLAELVAGTDLSPKLATPVAQAALRGYAEATGVQTEGFHAFGSLSSGGLSRLWGAMTPRFEAADFDGYPITLDDLAPSYDAVAARIGMSRPGLDGPAMTGAVARVFGRLAGDAETRIEPALNAVTMSDRDGRRGCIGCGLCLWGCERKSIFSSADEVPMLLRHSNFSYRPGAVVRALARAGLGWRVESDAGTVAAPIVVLAAGTIATTALAARLCGALGTPIRLLTNPVAACAFVVPGLIGAGLPEQSFGLAQLRHETPIGDDGPGAGGGPRTGGGSVGGAIYGADTLPLSELARRIPASRPTALRLSRALAPALLVATLYLPGRFSQNRITVTDDAVAIAGEITDAARTALRDGRDRLARTLRRAGAYAVPGSFTVSGPGADAHYAGTIPMGGAGPLACSRDGELIGQPGLFVADGAALSALPSKHCTLTIMANADRIGQALATSRPSAR